MSSTDNFGLFMLNPFPGKLLVNRRLTAPDSPDTRHFEIDLTGWGLSFEVGHSMAIYASNDPALVNEIMSALCATGDEIVPAGKETCSFREALSRYYSIKSVTPKFLKAIAERASSAPLLKELLDPRRKQDLALHLRLPGQESWHRRNRAEELASLGRNSSVTNRFRVRLRIEP